MDVEEEIQKSKAKIKELYDDLADEEKEILKKILDIHAQNIHIKRPKTAKDIVQIIKGRIKE